MADNIVLREVKESVMLEQRVRESVALDLIYLHVRRDPATSVNGAAAVGQLYFFVGGIVDVVAIKIIVIQRYIAVVALNQSPAWGVVLGRGQRQSGIVGERIGVDHGQVLHPKRATDSARLQQCIAV